MLLVCESQVSGTLSPLQVYRAVIGVKHLIIYAVSQSIASSHESPRVLDSVHPHTNSLFKHSGLPLKMLLACSSVRAMLGNEFALQRYAAKPVRMAEHRSIINIVTILFDKISYINLLSLRFMC